MEIYKASRQWAERPADQRFWTLKEMFSKTLEHASNAVEIESLPFRSLRVEAQETEVALIAGHNVRAPFSYHAFGQIAGFSDFSAKELRKLPPTLAAQVLNYQLKQRSDAEVGHENARIMLHRREDGVYVARSVTSEIYSRVWNWEIVERLLELEAQGWRVPPAWKPWGDIPGLETRTATPEDVVPGSIIKAGDTIAPSGLYASDHDMFAFMIFPENRINDGTEHGLARGAMFWNGELGGISIGRLTFGFRYVCGNHIVWGASDVKKLAIRHVGDVRGKFHELEAELTSYANSSPHDEEARIENAKRIRFGATKDAVLDALFNLPRKLTLDIPRKSLAAAYDLAEANTDADGDPGTAWGIAQGLTRLSQSSSFADERTKADRAAGRVLKIAG